jgi:EAL domain-containing protein (putative c-di-GMP-specific phosphodiesterase class I)
LFVDEEVKIATTYAAMLERTPYEVSVSSSGADALRLMAEDPFDVVVSDIAMPDMSGAELLTRVRADFPKTARIVLSGSARMEDTIRMINAAAVFRFLTKPCATAELVRCIDDAIAARGTRRSSIPASTRDLAKRFDAALETLWIATQPIVSMRSGRVVAFEALVRTLHPDFPHGGAIMETAEQLGRVRDIERRIRRIAADVAAKLPDGTSLLVNLHPSALDDPELVAADAPLSLRPDRVAFEITERARLEPNGAGADAIRSLRSRGHRIAIDDLGAGYAGLSSLVTLQPEIVKLDMELIRNVDTSPTRSKLVASLLALSKQLDIDVIAEGVESRAERDHLCSLGCDWMQGFFFARPSQPFPDVQNRA